LHGLDDLEVGNLKILVLRGVIILLRDEDALYDGKTQDREIRPQFNNDVPKRLDREEDSSRASLHTLKEVLIDCSSILLRDDHTGPSLLDAPKHQVSIQPKFVFPKPIQH